VKPAYHSITPLERAHVLRAPDPVANLDFMRGASIAAPEPAPWVFDIEIGGDRPPHLLGGRIPMASDRLLGVLRDAGVDNIQTFPALLRLRGGAEWRQHSVLNVIGLVDATDLDASVGTVLVEGDAGPARIDFQNLVLSPAKTRGLRIFRLFHDPALLLVDDRLQRALNKHRPPEGWGFVAFEVEMSDSLEST
jgi:hypothetical protein